jgi:hypothetical protein
MAGFFRANNKRRNPLIAVVIAAFYAVGFILAGHAVMNTRTAQGAIAGSVSLVFLPFVAVPACLQLLCSARPR